MLCMLMCMECVVLWVAAMQLLLSMAGIVCLVRRNYEQCWVCMVCWELSYFVNFFAHECGRYGLSLCGRLWREQYMLSTVFI